MMISHFYVEVFTMDHFVIKGPTIKFLRLSLLSLEAAAALQRRTVVRKSSLENNGVCQTYKRFQITTTGCPGKPMESFPSTESSTVTIVLSVTCVKSASAIVLGMFLRFPALRGDN